MKRFSALALTLFLLLSLTSSGFAIFAEDEPPCTHNHDHSHYEPTIKPLEEACPSCGSFTYQVFMHTLPWTDSGKYRTCQYDVRVRDYQQQRYTVEQVFSCRSCTATSTLPAVTETRWLCGNGDMVHMY